MRRILLLAMLAAVPGGWAEIIDRVAITVGDRVVTESEILLQIRVAAFLDGAPVDTSPERKRQAAERLIEQTLIRREIEISRYPTPSLPEADAVLAAARKQRGLVDDARFAAELARYGVTEEDVRQQVLWHLTLLRFLEYRFRPAVAPSEQDVKNYYDRVFVPRWKKLGKGPVPALEDRREEIEKAAADRMVDEALDRWLKQARAQTRIRFREEVFR